MIEVKDLTFRYNKRKDVLNNLSFTIADNQFVTILGHNGSGKSTLAKLLIGLLEAKNGSITIDNQELNENSVYDIRKKIGMVFQNPDNQFVGVTVKDDIAFGLENRQIPRGEMLNLINEYASLVGMSDFLEYNPENLSGGQKQRVAIAGILATKPSIIIFDEATSMLDPQGVKEVMDVLKELKHNVTIISITHNLQEALLADRVIVLNEGSIVLDDTPDEVFKQQEVLKKCKLDILDSMKIINMLSEEDKDLKELLWELTFKM